MNSIETETTLASVAIFHLPSTKIFDRRVVEKCGDSDSVWSFLTSSKKVPFFSADCKSIFLLRSFSLHIWETLYSIFNHAIIVRHFQQQQQWQHFGPAAPGGIVSGSHGCGVGCVWGARSQTPIDSHQNGQLEDGRHVPTLSRRGGSLRLGALLRTSSGDGTKRQCRDPAARGSMPGGGFRLVFGFHLPAVFRCGPQKALGPHHAYWRPIHDCGMGHARMAPTRLNDCLGGKRRCCHR